MSFENISNNFCVFFGKFPQKINFTVRTSQLVPNSKTFISSFLPCRYEHIKRDNILGCESWLLYNGNSEVHGCCLLVERCWRKHHWWIRTFGALSAMHYSVSSLKYRRKWSLKLAFMKNASRQLYELGQEGLSCLMNSKHHFILHNLLPQQSYYRKFELISKIHQSEGAAVERELKYL